ncbi:hypothetical protein [Rhodobium gokarnense]|uniref:Uncharacterized protein n=1 Tax=Rhodobium gokarnense TaxID=364296 RepID=A0ABT3HHC7_9HYPH|nr:hypothetical protein [Rhodobium gokarnense]MCW2309801.1 hypothetical protein [Rhodobium gokarnense]
MRIPRSTGGARRLRNLALVAALGTLAAWPAHAEEKAVVTVPGISLNQNFVAGVRAARSFNVENRMETFEFLLRALPPKVKVYPTENYFYFTFKHGGMEYAGNMRLDVGDRDDGVLHFAYFSKTEPWNMEILSQYKALNAEDGVKVEKVEDFLYRVTYKDISVEFQLNDLTGVKPPAARVAPQEDYLGPVFDESGVEFYFLFDRELKQFRFVLNEEGTPSDILVPYSEDTPVILVGMRTGFVFFDDRRQDRKLLIGVNRVNVEANNYFDGPFDQLPDNFMLHGEFKAAILQKHPSLKDEIDDHGVFIGQDGRFLVNPYVNYYRLNQLDSFYRCIDPGLDRTAYYNCLTAGDDEEDRGKGLGASRNGDDEGGYGDDNADGDEPMDDPADAGDEPEDDGTSAR